MLTDMNCESNLDVCLSRATLCPLHLSDHFMLEQLQTLAARMRWTHPLLMLTGIFALIFSGWVVTGSNTSAEESLMIPAILVFGWCFLLLTFLALFKVVPPVAVPGMPFSRRIRLRLRRALLWVIALGFIALTIALLIVSAKLLATWLTA